MSLMLITGVGFWDPLAFLAGFLILLLISYIIRSMGEESYGKGIQLEAFFSGDIPPGKGIHVGNLYWGFSDALRGYYKKVVALHTGIVNDYVAWFVALMAIILILITLI